RVTAAPLVPTSFGRVGVQVTEPDSPIALTAPVEQGVATRSCTCVELTCLAPTAPLMILRPPTASDFSFQLPTLPFLSWAVPTLPAGSCVAAYPTPPRATNRATNEMTSDAEGRRRTSDENRKFEPPRCLVTGLTTGLRVSDRNTSDRL